MTTTPAPYAPRRGALLHPDELEAFHRDGFVTLPGFIAHQQLDQLRGWISEIEAWPADEGDWFQHDEQSAHGVVRARTENFSPFHGGLAALLTTGELPEMAGQLLGEPAVLYKEKINYKNPGGGGYAAHQDAPAYPHIAVSVSCLLSVDDATALNGCLEFAAGQHHQLLVTDGHGCIRPDIADSLPWRPEPVPAGSLVWFHSHTPHRSGTNDSDSPRRALYLTYNGASLGDRREQYYAQKRAAFTAGPRADGRHQRLSLIGHFRGIAPQQDQR